MTKVTFAPLILPLHLPNLLVRKLSHPQLFNLHLANHYRLKRSAMGWWPENHPRWGGTEIMKISSPATIRSLWRMGLLDGTPDAHILGQTGTATLTPEVWTNDRGKTLLADILRDTGIFLDVSTDTLIYPGDDEADYGSVSVH